MMYDFFECGCCSKDDALVLPCVKHEFRALNEKRVQLVRWIYSPYPLTEHEMIREVKRVERLSV